MYEAHPYFIGPPDDAFLWRYMDFPKLLGILQYRALFFARADLLKDPWEGATSPITKKSLEDFLRQHGLNDFDLQRISQVFQNQRKHTYISCWHESIVESAAMWNLYSLAGQGFALRTTFGRLKSCFQEISVPVSIYIGRVNYRDYTTEAIPTGNTFWPYLHKRSSFRHEAEVRAITQYTTVEDVRFDPFEVVTLPVDLSQLIERVFVAPGTRRWMRRLTERILDQYGLNVSVQQSDLDARPVF